jgi:hypothetical protein
MRSGWDLRIVASFLLCTMSLESLRWLQDTRRCLLIPKKLHFTPSFNRLFASAFTRLWLNECSCPGAIWECWERTSGGWRQQWKRKTRHPMIVRVLLYHPASQWIWLCTTGESPLLNAQFGLTTTPKSIVQLESGPPFTCDHSTPLPLTSIVVVPVLDFDFL